MTNYDKAVHKTAQDLNLPIMVVRKVYKEFWRYIKNQIECIPMLEKQLTEEEFNQYETVFNVPSLCKVYCTYEHYLDKLQKNKNQEEYVKNKKSSSNV